MAETHEVTLIGVCDGAIGDGKRYPLLYLTNKVGGLPDVLPVISWQYPSCVLCNGILAHVVQVYCPLEASLYHRTLHLLACPNPQCSSKSESWKVLRSQCLESEIKPSPELSPSPHSPGTEAPIAATDWCDGADDWGMEDEEESACLSDTTQTQVKTTEANLEPVMRTAELDVSGRLRDLCLGEREAIQLDIPTFSPFYVSVVEETDLVEPADLHHAQNLLKEYERREGVAVAELGTCDGGGDEKYEKTRARHGDAVFSRFMKKISLCPVQILRYCWNGSPLYISEPPSNMAQMVPVCARCGSSRTFELQLMPALVSLLRSKDCRSEMAGEFGTVLVYTCRNSCWTWGSTSPVEELIFIQQDPDQKLFK
uniref:Programmed cell death protein 2 n=1 Tax=Osmerus mordax TaxID=8014 RepID=C1BKK3_OSMMO|nr:Programmed cell death protein 2 [Osmerus mordax]